MADVQNVETPLSSNLVQCCGNKKEGTPENNSNLGPAFAQMELFDPKKSKPVHELWSMGGGMGKALGGEGGFMKPLKKLCC